MLNFKKIKANVEEKIANITETSEGLANAITTASFVLGGVIVVVAFVGLEKERIRSGRPPESQQIIINLLADKASA